MISRTINLGIPRRAVGYYFLFALLAVTWLSAHLLLLFWSVVLSETEQTLLDEMLARQPRLARQVHQASPSDLQAVVDELARDRPLAYCALVSRDQNTLAHTRRGRVGEQYPPPIGDRRQVGDVEVVRVKTSKGMAIREYSLSLSNDNHDSSPTLRVAIQEPSLQTLLVAATGRASLMLLVPFALVALGGYVIHRNVQSVGRIEQQLISTARAAELADAGLATVNSRDLVVLGWNRIIESLPRGNQLENLGARLGEAVQAFRQERSEEVLNSLPDGLAIVDASGRLAFANQSLLGLSVKGNLPWQGQSVIDLLELEGTAVASWGSDPATRSKSMVEEIDRQQGGSRRVLRVARHPLRSQRENSGHIWVVRDVTQQRLSEEMRSQFLDSATHELRTPLANIKAYAETLTLSEVLDIESQKKFCNTINSEATRLARFIDDLLSISSMEAGSLAVQRQEVDLGRLFKETIEKVRPQFDRKRIRLDVVLPEKLPAARLDKDKFNVALVNLLGNAAKYTLPEGEVGFRVNVVNSVLRIEIQDTGVGISEEELPRVFEKFFRSKNQSVQEESGTGLGLPMALEVVRLHDGDITAESVLGKGTTFTVTVPI